MMNQSSWPTDAFYLIPFYSKSPISPTLQDGIASIMSAGDGGPHDITGPLFKIPYFLETKFPLGVWFNTTVCDEGESQMIDLSFLQDKVKAKLHPIEKTLDPFNGFIGSGPCYNCPTYF